MTSHWTAGRSACLGALLLSGVAGALVGAGSRGQEAAPIDPGALAALILWMPAVEELAFRGCLQTLLRLPARLRRECCGVTGANLCSSGLFTLAHVPAQGPGWALAIAGPSLLLGAVRDRTDRILPCVLLHVWFNLTFFSGRLL